MSEGDAEGGDDSSESVVEIDPDEPELGPPTFQPEKRTTNIVMVDDMKKLKELADAARKLEAEAAKARLKAGISIHPAIKSTSGVTITPAKPRTIPLPLGGTLLGSGVTISPSGGKPVQCKVDLPLPAGTTLTSVKTLNAALSVVGNGASLHSSFSYDKRGQLQDPNLTDDTYVVEAPSFIVPYFYEKPPKETFKDFKDSINKLITNNKNEDLISDDKNDLEKPAKDKVEKLPSLGESLKPPSAAETFFESPIGKLLGNLGMNLVQEHVQHDLLREQMRRAKKDKSALVMHAIILLKKNLESSKDTNESFHFELKRCRLCSFKTESILVLENHIQVPHCRNGVYRCYYCPEESKNIYDVANHMGLTHGVRPRLERPIAPNQCPQCPFEDNLRGKVNRHKIGCDKRFRSEHNQEPPHDWEPPAKIPKPSPFVRMVNSNLGAAFGSNLSMPSAFGLGFSIPRPGITTGFNDLNQSFLNNSRSASANLPQLQFGPRGRGRPVGTYKPGLQPGLRANMPSRAINQVSTSNQTNRFQGLNNLFLNSLGANPSITIQSVSQRNQTVPSGQPSISITPLSGRGTIISGKPMSNQQTTLPDAQKAAKPKRDIVICEICDGYIKDLEQLKNHMQWIHKVQIHPKMIYNRPPLNCQKCQCRFFTDQGLERHLLGSHGLVTASMQDLANKNQDSGRCPICGKVYQWKLLNHVSKVHNKTLKPAHLSYKCTVCTATFEQYKLFETHVYSAHGTNKRANNGEASQAIKPPEKTSISPTSEKSSISTVDKISSPKQEAPLGVSLLKKPFPVEEKAVVEVTTKLQPEYDVESGDDGIEEIEDDDD